MDGNVVALVVAVSGVIGTLSSPVITQRLSARNRREEADALRRDALESREQGRREAIEREKKAAYIAFNAAARRYRVELMNYLHVIDNRVADETDKAELREARRVYSSSFAEVQIMARDEVLERVEEVTSRLSRSFRAIKNIEDGVPQPGWSFDETQRFLIEAWDLWVEMRRVMRSDLGLED